MQRNVVYEDLRGVGTYRVPSGKPIWSMKSPCSTQRVCSFAFSSLFSGVLPTNNRGLFSKFSHIWIWINWKILPGCITFITLEQGWLFLNFWWLKFKFFIEFWRQIIATKTIEDDLTSELDNQKKTWSCLCQLLI